MPGGANNPKQLIVENWTPKTNQLYSGAKPLIQRPTFMQNEQIEVWTTPDFEAIPTNMECTAYSETL